MVLVKSDGTPGITPIEVLEELVAALDAWDLDDVASKNRLTKAEATARTMLRRAKERKL
jgi:hypothetical protein